MADSTYYQGDYIQHPVLYELSHKYGLQPDSDPDAALPYKLEELKEHIRREIRKELKIKEGAEKLREVAKDRRSLADVATIVKKANSKLTELQAELQELESQIIMTQGQTTASSPPLSLNNGQDAFLSPILGHVAPTQGDALFSDMRLLSLEKQLNIELKVKQGAENMIQSLTSGHSRDKKLLQEAQQMLADSRVKIEFLKLRILKIKQNKQLRQQQGTGTSDMPSNGDTHQIKDKYEPNLEPPLEDRVEELRHRLRIEAAVVEGAKNVIRLLQSSKVADKKALQEPATDKCTYHSPAHRLSHSPARLRGWSPLLYNAGHKTKSFDCTPSQAFSTFKGKNNRKPRTVHIDVYCTGSEDADASGTSDDSEEMSDSWSSPQTVFESEKLKVFHKGIGKNKFPMGYLHRQLQQNIAGIPSQRSESCKYDAVCSTEQQVSRGYESDDGLSSCYPSQLSSFSALQGVAETSISQSDISSSTSREPSWSTIPTSSLAFSDDYDSAAATTCKDTTSDADTMVQSTVSLAQSDSFEYADSADRLRIREKEIAWAGSEAEGEGSKTWKSPHVERKYLLQQQKFKEFIQKHLGKSSDFPLWKAETSEDSDDETGDAWSFYGQDSNASPIPTGKSLKREDTVKRVCSGRGKDVLNILASKTNKKPNTSTLLTPFVHDTGIVSDSGFRRLACRTNIGPFGSKLPSPPPSKLVSSVNSPFTTIPGKRTEQLSKAEKFGTIVGTFRKPGHHIGPSKNPVCACEHCRKYYEDTGYRSRTQSVGEVSLNDSSNRNSNGQKGNLIIKFQGYDVYESVLE